MTLYETEQHLNNLHQELDIANSCDEMTARKVFNVDCKDERIIAIQDEIDTYNSILQEINKPSIYELELAGERYGYDFY